MGTNTVIPTILVLMVAIWVLGGAVQRREAFRRQVAAEYQRIVACRIMEEDRSGGGLRRLVRLAAPTDDPAWQLAVATVVANRQRAAVLRGQVRRELHRRGY